MLYNLSKREEEIFYYVVVEYLSTGEIIPSKIIAKKYGVGLSAATIRNVMSILEEKGLLYQPHTSSGRIPTDEGLKYFINDLMKISLLTKERQIEIETKIKELKNYPENYWEGLGSFLSDLTGQATIIISPPPYLITLNKIIFVPIGEGRIIAIIIPKYGKIMHKIIATDVKISPSEFERIHNYLNSIINGKSLAEIREIIRIDLLQYQQISSSWILKALNLGENAVKNIGQTQVVIEGRKNLLSQSEIIDKEELEKIFYILEEKQKLLTLIDQTILEGIKVYIGSDIPFGSIINCGLIVGSYKKKENSIGLIGIFGSRRMNYPQIIPIINFIGNLLTQ